MKPHFAEIWIVDFSCKGGRGEVPEPTSLLAKELMSGRLIALGAQELRSCSIPPYSIDEDSLFIAYDAEAEVGCHMTLGWPLPSSILSLQAESANLRNGDSGPAALEEALQLHLELARDTAHTGGKARLPATPWGYNPLQAPHRPSQARILNKERLFSLLEPQLEWSTALLRGRYMHAVASIERNGVPLDTQLHDAVVANRTLLRDALISELDVEHGFYRNGSFSFAALAAWVKKNQVAWPRTEQGLLSTADKTLEELEIRYPKLVPMRKLRKSLQMLKRFELSVGLDGRSRFKVRPFASTTGRNQPLSRDFIFNHPHWLRHLVKPLPGMGLAYIDYEQQEFGIAAALSGDANMKAVYSSDDPYLAFARMAGAVDSTATKASHPEVRERFKQCALATLYGMGPDKLAERIGQQRAYAVELLGLHKLTFPSFWAWSDNVVSEAALSGQLTNPWGWRI